MENAPVPREAVLWAPRCPRCGKAAKADRAVPGDHTGPADGRIDDGRSVRCPHCGMVETLGPDTDWVQVA